MSNLPVVDSGSGELIVRAYLVKAIHGRLQNKEPASLIVADFKFISKKSSPYSSQRIVSAIVGFSFAGLASIDGPIVHDIAPKGPFSIEPSEHQTTNIIGSVPNIFAQRDGVQVAKPVRQDSWDNKATSVGRIRVSRSHYKDTAKKDTAKWDLLEDSAQKAGIPSCFRTAIILQRKDDEPFLATVEIKASVSDASSFNTVLAGSFGQNITDDPIILNPTLPPLGDLDGVDPYNLDRADLNKLSEVPGTRIILSDGVKGNKSSGKVLQDRFTGRTSMEVDDGASLRSSYR